MDIGKSIKKPFREYVIKIMIRCNKNFPDSLRDYWVSDKIEDKILVMYYSLKNSKSFRLWN